MSTVEIHPLDLNFLGSPEAIAAFLILGPDSPVLVETGPGSTLPALKRELQRFGVSPADVRDVLVTHIHLDHAGAAGWWARQGARLHVHHLGAPHLIDPSKLLASAGRIYGDLMNTLWGEFLSVPVERVHSLNDGDVVAAGGLRFVAHDTPGHARHHLVYQLDDVAFVGDLAGIRLSGRRYLRMPTPPPEFDLGAWLTSLGRMRALNLRRLYLTHFGRVDDVAAHWAKVEGLLRVVTEEVGEALARGLGRDAIITQVAMLEETRQQAEGVDDATRAQYANTGPLEMSVDGLLRYWSKQASLSK